MASSLNDGNGIISGINVTPLVDIALVLLVIFIVTAKLIVTEAVPLELPRASHTEQVQVVFALSLPATGPTRVNGEAVGDDAALVRLARAALRENPELRVVIDADGAVPHRRVIHALDLVKSAGIARVAFGALATDDGAP
jgi:biopolymer transport protein ExbD